MKKNMLIPAFLLVFAFSINTFADGETGQGNKTSELPPSTVQTQSSNSSAGMFAEMLDAMYKFFS